MIFCGFIKIYSREINKQYPSICAIVFHLQNGVNHLQLEAFIAIKRVQNLRQLGSRIWSRNQMFAWWQRQRMFSETLDFYSKLKRLVARKKKFINTNQVRRNRRHYTNSITLYSWRAFATHYALLYSIRVMKETEQSGFYNQSTNCNSIKRKLIEE